MIQNHIKETKELLEQNMDKLDAVATVLIEKRNNRRRNLIKYLIKINKRSISKS